MKILVIGKKGNLGRELAHTLADHELVLWDRDEIDVTNEVMVQEKILAEKPDVVFNCAAYTNVDQAEEDYAAAQLLNGYAAGYVAKACKAIDATLVHFSTGMVFAGDNPSGYAEDATPNPVNAYGQTKLLGETEIQKVGGKYYIIRSEWLYAKPTNTTAKKSFNEIIIELAEKNDSLQGVSDEFGKPTWAKDLAKAAGELALSTLPTGIYHITNEGQASRLEWAQEILRQKNITKPIQPVLGKQFPRPAKRPHYELLNNNKLPELRSWQEALQEYLKEM